MVELIPMTEEEFQAYYDMAVDDYAQEHVTSGNWQASEAHEKSAEEFKHYLPEGLASKNQYLFSIKDDQTGSTVGMIWFALRDQVTPPRAFIYDFRINKAFQRKGYGRQTLRALEDKARELGIDTIALHVFGHNEAAIALYQKAGYEITNLHMAKKVNGSVAA
jgi:RimJ/RimL family protein N-acetyltransferase